MGEEQVSKQAQNSFVAKLVSNPAQVPDLMLLRGYVGESSAEKHTRLYLNADLSDYVDLPSDEIVLREDVPRSADPLGAVFVWIRRNAAMIRKGMPCSSEKAEFFKGDIQKDQMAGNVSPNVGPTGVQYCTQSPPYCGYTAWQGCPPVVGPTGVQYCTQSPLSCGYSVWQGCPPVVGGPTGVQYCVQAPLYTAWQGCLPVVGPTGVQHCTQAPQYCGNTAWAGCPRG